MHLLFDARVLQPHFPGIGRYAQALLEALVEVVPGLQLTLLTERGAERPTLDNSRWLEGPPIFSPASQLRIPWLARQVKADLFHAPYYLYPFLVRFPVVVTIHDVIPLEFEGMLPKGIAGVLYRPLHLLAARRASHVITDSERAREAILQHLGLPGERVSVVHAAPAPYFTADVAVERETFLFSLISNKPHKNGARLIRAFAATDPSSHGVRLLLAGPTDPDWPLLEEEVAQSGVGEWVTVLGRLTDTALREHYRKCLAFVFPSFAEGFGLPVLEAMACGAPTATANVPPMRDLAGDAALQFDPFDVTAMAQGLQTLIHDPAQRSALSRAGLSRAAGYTWRRVACETAAIYEGVLRERQMRSL